MAVTGSSFAIEVGDPLSVSLIHCSGIWIGMLFRISDCQRARSWFPRDFGLDTTDIKIATVVIGAGIDSSAAGARRDASGFGHVRGRIRVPV
ncbi:MAG: hypothetical protein ACTICP_16065 [Microbacterium sp.]